MSVVDADAHFRIDELERKLGAVQPRTQRPPRKAGAPVDADAHFRIDELERRLHPDREVIAAMQGLMVCITKLIEVLTHPLEQRSLK